MKNMRYILGGAALIGLPLTLQAQEQTQDPTDRSTSCDQESSGIQRDTDACYTNPRNDHATLYRH